ncbi:sensor histidine kinase [Microtetraspora malaysiensis]|uniref:histidine kinase n=1 Tax=Microtetraspora malaysiensis TaxID=161358 RepID=A0ABW6SS00_9ACTN
MRWTVRLRLTLLYSGLFLAAAVLLTALTYFLVRYSPFSGPPVAPVSPGGNGPLTETPQIEGQQVVTLRRLLVNSVIALAVMAFASTFLGWLMARRVLRPLGDMTATVRRITADQLDRRLAASGPDDELKELADTFDGLLDRLEAAFTAQRRFVANASHELRTPLTLQQAMIEVALADPEIDVASLRAVLERLLAAGQQQERLIAALLTLARGQQGVHRREPFDLAAITEQAVGQRGDRGLRVESELRPAPGSGDRDLVERLVGNLLDNAVRHNVRGGWITVATGVTAGCPTLRVSNSGPVIPPSQVGTLLKPFQRLEGGRRATGKGAGLGLSIVAAIVEAHHGTLEARALAEGGLEVTVVLGVAAGGTRPG